MMKRRSIYVFMLIMAVLLIGCGKKETVGNTEESQKAESSQNTENLQNTESELKGESEVDTEVESTQAVVQQPEHVEEPEVEEKPAVTYSYAEMQQVMYATNNVNVRRGPNKDFEKVGNLNLGDEVAVTGKCNETGWYRIRYGTAEGYVSNAYLTSEKPAAAMPRQYYDTGDAELNALCDEVLNELVDSSMTEREAAYKVYCWVESKIKYKGDTEMVDWVAIAKEGLVTYRGNCFAYYSVSRALLTRLGYENVMATSYNNTHYWNMVKVDGNWWHWDTTNGWGTQRFLWTSEQLLAYKKWNAAGTDYICYKWNPEGCPETP